MPKLLCHNMFKLKFSFWLCLVIFLLPACGSSSDDGVYDFMIFASAYPGSYGIGGAMQATSNRLQLKVENRAYEGFFVRLEDSDVERSLLYDMLSRKKVNIMFFPPESTFSVLGLMARYPEQKFVLPYVLDLSRHDLPPNLRMAQLRLEQGAFLAGLIAGKMSRNNRIAMLTDMSQQSTKVSMLAFVQGIRLVNPSSEVIIVRSSSAENVLENETMRLVSADDIDTIFAMSVNYNNIIIRAAYYFDNDVLLINSWYNADREYNKNVITSLLISFDPIMYNIMRHSDDFHLLPMIRIYDLADKDVMRFSWDDQEGDTAFELERPEYRELSRKTRQEAAEWAQRIRNKEFMVFNALERGLPTAELLNFRFRDSQNFGIVP